LSFQTRSLAEKPDTIAPDGSEVRLLSGVRAGSMAHFTLPPGAVAKPVAHRTIEEVWLFLAGKGRMWRKLGDVEEVVEVGPGVSISLPVGTKFQFRCDGAEPLRAVGVSMPPWPGDDEAYPVEGPWAPRV
jgi:mannose-6-phosphate isomerase-like protein (cupin superfamily)